jgi:hypothetical protein
MQKHLASITQCDQCGNKEDQLRSVGLKHSNGNREEKLEFGCGRLISFSPNFMKIEDERRCKHSPEHIAARELAKSLKPQLVEFAREKGLNEAGLQHLAYSIQFLDSYI